MRVFVTGATGFVGSAVVQDLIAAGHKVLGLARSDTGAASLAAAGAEVHRGDLEDLDSLRRGAASSDGVIHTGFIHDFSRFQEVCEADRRAIEALGDALAGSDRPWSSPPGPGWGPRCRANPRPRTTSIPTTRTPVRPRKSRRRRSPRVACACRWCACRRCITRRSKASSPPRSPSPARRASRLTSATGSTAGLRCICSTPRPSTGWPSRRERPGRGITRSPRRACRPETIAEAIGRGLKIPVVSMSPEEAAGHFGWLGFFAGMDMPASSALTQQRLGWRPTQKAGMIDDLDHMNWSGG